MAADSKATPKTRDKGPAFIVIPDFIVASVCRIVIGNAVLTICIRTGHPMAPVDNSRKY